MVLMTVKGRNFHISAQVTVFCQFMIHNFALQFTFSKSYSESHLQTI